MCAQMLLSNKWRDTGAAGSPPHALAQLLESLRIWQACASVRVFFVTADEAFPALLFCLTPPALPPVPHKHPSGAAASPSGAAASPPSAPAPSATYKSAPAVRERMQRALDSEPASLTVTLPARQDSAAGCATVPPAEGQSSAAARVPPAEGRSSAAVIASAQQQQGAALRCALTQQAAVLVYVLLQDTFPSAAGALAWTRMLPADMDDQPCAAMVSAGCMQQLAAALPACIRTLTAYDTHTASAKHTASGTHTAVFGATVSPAVLEAEQGGLEACAAWAAGEMYRQQYARAERDAEVRAACLSCQNAVIASDLHCVAQAGVSCVTFTSGTSSHMEPSVHALDCSSDRAVLEVSWRARVLRTVVQPVEARWIRGPRSGLRQLQARIGKQTARC